MKEAARCFAGLGAPKVVLSSAAHNLSGQAFFRKLGYRDTMVELTLDLKS